MQNEEVNQLREQLNRIQNTLLQYAIKPKLTKEQEEEEHRKKMQEEQEKRHNILQGLYNDVALGLKTVEMVYNEKRTLRFNSTIAEEDFMSPSGIRRAGIQTYKEARKCYIENLINIPDFGFYRLPDSSWRAVCKMLGYLSNPMNPKDIEACKNEQYAKVEIYTVYETFLNKIINRISKDAVIKDFFNLFEGQTEFNGVKVVPYTFV